MREKRIVDARARPLDVPMKRAFGISGGAQEVARNVLVTVELASGVRGFGEAAPFPAFNGETQEGALATLAGALPALVGRDVHDAFDLDARGSALCAIETALVDARARAARVPLWRLVGGQYSALRAVGPPSAGPRAGDLRTDVTIVTGTAERAAEDARAFRAFRTLKIKIGGGDVDDDVRRVLAVAAERPDAEILLDANGGLSPEEAVRLAGELARRGVVPSLFEQPIAAGDWDALAEVRAKTRLRIAIDESVARVADVHEAARRRAADAVNVKITKSGFFEAVAIARAAADAGLDRMIGGMVETRLAMGTSACIAAGLGGFRIVDLDTPLFLADDPFEGGYAYDGDRIDLSPVDTGHGCTPKFSSRPSSSR